MAIWLKNEPTASMRRCLLRVMNMATGQLASRSIDFTSYLYITRGAAKSYKALGTIENHRRDLVVADDVVESVDTGADTLTLTGHSYETGDGPFVSDEAMGALTIGTQFWIINPNTGGTGGDLISIASSLADAYAGTVVPLTGTETGATISDVPGTTERGIDGEFIVTATQAETNYSVAELIISVFGYADHEGQTTVTIDQAGSVWDAMGADGVSRGDEHTAMYRNAVAPIETNPITGEYVVRDAADSKDSHHGTLASTGRSNTGIDNIP